MFIKFPNHMRKIGGKLYFFTHGYFLEDEFTPLEFLIEALSLEELEAFNIIWLEAIDYYLGHSGRFSGEVRRIVELFWVKNKSSPALSPH